MELKYYKVMAKCGHVGRNYYILKWFYVKACDGKAAAKIVRNKPRVKHDHKYAIQQVVEITVDEYLLGLKIQLEDKYFQCSSKQEQESYKCISQDDLLPEEREQIKYKKNRNGQRLKNQMIYKEMQKEIRGVF